MGIDNGFSNSKSYVQDGWISTDNIRQSYTLSWNEDVTQRLSISSNFTLTIVDTFNSVGVDNKTVAPSLGFNFSNPTWSLGLDLKNNILYTNEFNKQRRDEAEFALTLNVTPFYLPPVMIKSNRKVLYQPLLNDKVDEKFDFNTNYSMGDFVLDASWVKSDGVDKIEIAETSQESWRFNLSYGTPLTGGIRFSESLAFTGDASQSVFQATPSLSTEKHNRSLSNGAKLDFGLFPGVDTSFELVQARTTDSSTRTKNFSAKGTQNVLATGTLEEEMKYTWADVEADVDSNDFTSSHKLAFTGSPSRYLNYSSAYTIDVNTVSSDDPTKDVDTRNDALNLTLTSRALNATRLQVAYSDGRSYDDKELSGKNRALKMSLNYDQGFGFYELSFKPTLQINRDKDVLTGETTAGETLKLEIDYGTPFPKSIGLIVTPTYSREVKSGNDPIATLNVDYQLVIETVLGGLDLKVNNKGSYTDQIDDSTKGTFSLLKEMQVLIGADLTGNLRGRLTYTYTLPDVGENADDVNVEFSHTYLDYSGVLTFKQKRAFGGPKSVDRLVEASFTMAF